MDRRPSIKAPSKTSSPRTLATTAAVEEVAKWGLEGLVRAGDGSVGAPFNLMN